MWRLTLTMMKKNVRMLVPADIAVVISTMFITCSLIFGDAMSASIKDGSQAKLAGVRARSPWWD